VLEDGIEEGFGLAGAGAGDDEGGVRAALLAGGGEGGQPAEGFGLVPVGSGA